MSGWIIFIALLGLVVPLNIWHYLSRRHMTKEQKRQEDEDIKNDWLSWWP